MHIMILLSFICQGSFGVLLVLLIFGCCKLPLSYFDRDLDANQQFIQESVSIKVRARYLESTWQPAMISETNTFDYWVNWSFFMCAIVVLFPMIVASILIRKYEGSDATKNDNGETLQETTGALYGDECWRPCLKGIHPAWLLGFCILAFSMLLALLIIKVVIHRGSIYFYYTQ